MEKQNLSTSRQEPGYYKGLHWHHSFLLFIVVLDYVLRLSLDDIMEMGLMTKPRQIRRHQAEYLTDLAFADDVALISRTTKDSSL